MSKFVSNDLLFAMLLRFGGAFVVLSLIFFVSSGTLSYWQGWLYLLSIFVPAGFTTLYFLKRDPGFLEKRMRMGEKRPQQNFWVNAMSVLLIASFIIPGLDYRFGWSSVPVELVLLADAVVFFSYLGIFLVFRENRFASRLVEVQKGQRVISTGPYSLVRHPMYSFSILLFGLTPIALGSFYALLALLPLPFFMARRVLDEETLLRKDLPGYVAYCRKVGYRLVPGVW